VRSARSAACAGAIAAVVACLVSAIACGGSSTPTQPSAPPGPAPAPVAAKRLLVVTHTAGFRHDSIPRAEQVLADLARQNGSITVSFCRTAADVTTMLATASLASIDGVFFANTTGDLGIPDLGGFLAWIRSGHPFLAAHSATDTYHGDSRYLEMIGAEFDTHGDQTEVNVTVEDRTHPATAALPLPFRIFDEIYLFRANPRPSVHVLLSLDRHPMDGLPGAGQPGDFVLAWTRAYGAGKVFYTALGHRIEVWDDLRFQAHLAGALSWAFAP
jgi:type 1 glutamine amidotransferase